MSFPSMTAKGHAMVPNSKPKANDELDRLEERAREAARRGDTQSVNEFLNKFEKDYRANIEERKKSSK